MDIKKSASLFIFLTIAGNCLAQVKWSVKTGLNYSNIRAQDQNGVKANTSSVPGIHLGLGAGFRLSGQFSLQPSLVYAKRGFKQNGSSYIGLGEDFEADVSYVELPIDLLYSPKLGPGNLLLAASPYLGYGTGGQWKSSGTVLMGDIMINGKGEVAFQNDNSYHKDMNTYVYAKPWDYGAYFKIGYSLFNQYAITFDMQQGIADLQPRWSDYQPKSKVRNRSMGVSFAYSF